MDHTNAARSCCGKHIRPAPGLASLSFAALLMAFPFTAPGTASAIGPQIKLFSATTGYVVGGGGIYFTNDGGTTWRQMAPPLEPGKGATVQSLFFLNESQGWAIVRTEAAPFSKEFAYYVSATVDSGETWSYTPFTWPTPPDGLEPDGAGDMFFLDQNHGWLVMVIASGSNFDEGRILATDDGGRTWHWAAGPGVAGRLYFTSTEDGWLAGGPGGERLYATRDGCKSWQAVSLAAPAEAGPAVAALYDAPVFRTAVRGSVAVTYQRKDGSESMALFRTADGGATWAPAAAVKRVWAGWWGAPAPSSFADSAWATPGESVGSLMVTRVGPQGSEESRAFSIGQAGPKSIALADGTNGWVLAGGRLLETSSGGAVWKDITPWHVEGYSGQPQAPGPPVPNSGLGALNIGFTDHRGPRLRTRAIRAYQHPPWVR